MDLLESAPSRRRPPAPLVVGLALGLLAAAQVVAVRAPQPLPGGVALAVPLENYSFTRGPERAVVNFELENTGTRPLQVLGLGASIPGLELRDVAASGEPVGFRSVGGGPQQLPAFALPAGGRVVLTLTFTASDCGAVPEQPRPLAVRVASGRGTGTLAVAPASLPDDRVGARADAVAAWQVALVRDLCRSS